MGKRGPKPKPSALKRLEGTYRPDRAAEHEVQPPRGAPSMNDAIRKDKYARACWESLVPQLKKLGLMSKIDGMAFEGLCIAYARARRADADVRLNGIVTRNAFGTHANPAVAISKGAWLEVRRFLQEFGLTPASRSRVNAIPEDDASGANMSPADKAKQSTESFLFGNVVGAIRPSRSA